MKQSFIITEPQFKLLSHHLFPGDGDEHGAVILAGVSDMPSGTRFLAREIILARDGTDYVPGTRGYRALTPDFVARISDQCTRQKLCYFAVHCHGGRDSVGFSPDDVASHERGYPALLDITDGGPVGALVFAENAVAGEIWRRSGVSELDQMTIVGPSIRRLFPTVPAAPTNVSPMYHRQSMLFGERGQAALANAKVGVIGLGGVGSLVNQLLAHLGVGHIVAVDFDRLESTNRPRVVGATAWDAGEPFIHSRFAPIKALGKFAAKYKVRIAERVARNANPTIRYDAIVGDIANRSVALQLRDCDYLFLCADGNLPRLVFNAIVHQFLIPGVQIGSKVPVEKSTGRIGDVAVHVRPVLPHPNGGCLYCNQLIQPDKLREESMPEHERRAAAYVADEIVKNPSVITLNAVGAGQAVDDFLFSFHALLQAHVKTGYAMHLPRERLWQSVDLTSDPVCLQCGSSPRSVFARGDRSTLPCRTSHS